MRAILKDKRFIALVILIILTLFLAIAGLMYLNAFLGALIIFVISTPLNNWLKSKGMKPSIAAWVIIILTLLIIIIPLFFIIQGLAEQITLLPQSVRAFDSTIENLNAYLPLDIEIDRDIIIQKIVPFLEKGITPFFSNIISIIANLILFYFILYYLLVNDKRFINQIKSMLPFNEKNKTKILDEFGNVTKATVIGSILIAIVQGTMLWIGFHVLGIKGALFWGFVTAVLSLVPVIGSPIIWGPGALFLFLSGDPTKGFLLIIWGILITFVDNIIRPITNKKYGKIHPLTSILGVFIGVAQFGFIGILVGPLLLSYFLLLCKIYKEEYLDNR